VARTFARHDPGQEEHGEGGGEGRQSVHAGFLRVVNLKRGDGTKQRGQQAHQLTEGQSRQTIDQRYGEHPQDEGQKPQGEDAGAGQPGPEVEEKVIERGIGFRAGGNGGKQGQTGHVGTVSLIAPDLLVIQPIEP